MLSLFQGIRYSALWFQSRNGILNFTIIKLFQQPLRFHYSVYVSHKVIFPSLNVQSAGNSCETPLFPGIAGNLLLSVLSIACIFLVQL